MKRIQTKHIIIFAVIFQTILGGNQPSNAESVLKSFKAPQVVTKIENKLNINKTPQTNTINVNSTNNNSATAQAQPNFPSNALQPQTGIIYKEASYTINTIDPVGNPMTAFYPGFRGKDQLIIYTPVYGIKTGTNEFGTEAIVSGNTVTQVNGADSLIPKDGFVISGHGNAKKWINENISTGSKIYVDVDNKILKSYLTADSFIFAAKEKIKQANSIMEYYRNIDILYDDKASTNYIIKSKDLLRNAEKDPENAQVYVTEAMENANLAIKNAIPYKADEVRGVWIRPTEKSPEEIVSTIERLKDIGINNVFLETYFHGKTIYPSAVLAKYGVTNQREEFMGFDPLKIWVTECRRRDIKLNVWFETFYVGNTTPSSNPRNVLNVYPKWANTTKSAYSSTTPVASLSEHNGYFIDPANPEVQKYLLEIIQEIITNYCPDGINLDYIRYPQSISPKFSTYDMTNWGYTEFARNEFKSQYNIDPVDIKYGQPMWDNWALYRQNKVTDFVGKVRKVTVENNISLTAVIFPDRQRNLEVKMQDWKTWSLNNYVDGFTPLILTSDKSTAKTMINDIKSNSSIRTKIYPGLFVTFMGGTFDDLLMQIQEARELNSGGIVLFDYAHLDQKYIDALKVRVFNPCSICTPNKNYYNYGPSVKKRKLFKFNCF